MKFVSNRRLHQHLLEKTLKIYRLDFYISQYNLVIEIDGEFHFNSKFRPDRDIYKALRVIELGRSIMRISGPGILQLSHANFNNILHSASLYSKKEHSPSYYPNDDTYKRHRDMWTIVHENIGRWMWEYIHLEITDAIDIEHVQPPSIKAKRQKKVTSVTI